MRPRGTQSVSFDKFQLAPLSDLSHVFLLVLAAHSEIPWGAVRAGVRPQRGWTGDTGLI